MAAGVKLPSDVALVERNGSDPYATISPELVKYMQVRIKPGYEKYLQLDKDGNLKVPHDMVSGFSSILQ